jgi:hypothetical protein
MNLLNIAKHLLYLAQIEYGSDNSTTTADETFAAERLFQVLKSFKDSYFSEVYTYDTLEFDDEYDEMTDGEDNDNDVNEYDEMNDGQETDNDNDDFNENEHSTLQHRFTLEEMERIIE